MRLQKMPAIDSDLIFDIDALHFSIDGQFSPITASGYEHIILGREEDYFIGDIDRDWIETGGGADNIYAGAGDDVIKIQLKLVWHLCMANAESIYCYSSKYN